MASEKQIFAHDKFTHLSEDEWGAVLRMVDTIGEGVVVAMLTSLSEADQHKSILAFVQREARLAQNGAESAQKQIALLMEQSAQLQQQLAQLAAERQRPVVVDRPRVEPLKLDVSKYRGSENESLLRWFLELEAAISARRINDAELQVRFAMSHLAGRAKSWAYGKLLAEPNCFPNYTQFRAELRMAFEPPKTEFRARAEFLELRQGKRDIHKCDPIYDRLHFL